VAATFEKANTYVFAGMVIMNPKVFEETQEVHAKSLGIRSSGKNAALSTMMPKGVEHRAASPRLFLL
jgi:hypothetical protein